MNYSALEADIIRAWREKTPGFVLEEVVIFADSKPFIQSSRKEKDLMAREKSKPVPTIAKPKVYKQTDARKAAFAKCVAAKKERDQFRRDNGMEAYVQKYGPIKKREKKVKENAEPAAPTEVSAEV